LTAARWRRNLAALWLAEFTAIFGFAFAFPFLPVFLRQDLGIQGESALAFWSGIAAGATGFSMALTSPLWGMLADRYGRKPMLLRAMLGGGITVGLMGLAQSALQLTGLRLLQGAASGTVAAATALVAGETPRAEVAWALGILSSAISLGSAVGPPTGGVAARLFGLRWVFVGGGILLLASTLPVVFLVGEHRRLPVLRGSTTLRATLREAGPGTQRALGVLIGAQALMQSSFSASQQLVVIRILALDPSAASTITGIAFGAAGLATALAAVVYARVVRLGGYRNVTAVAALGMAVATGLAALAPTVPLLAVALVLVSFLFGALSPAVMAMVGLEAPVAIQATVYGVSASAISVGFGVGPLAGGFAAALAGAPIGLSLAAALALILAGLLWLLGREPIVAVGQGRGAAMTDSRPEGR